MSRINLVKTPMGPLGTSRQWSSKTLLVGLLSLVSAFLIQPLDAQWPENPERILLDTGMECFFQKDTSSPLTVVHLFISGGKADVAPGLDGLAYLATRLTLEIPDMDKARNLMSQATRLGMRVEEDYSVVSIECLSENLGEALRVASAIIQAPLYTSVRIGNTKDTMKIQGRAENDDSVAVGHGAVLEAFFKGNGRGGADFGSDDSLKTIGKKHLTAFYDSHFNKNNIFFCVSSDLDRDSVSTLLEESFNRFEDGGPDPEIPSSPPFLPGERIITRIRETKQSYVGQAFLLPLPSPSNYAKGFLLEVLFGKAPGSRLWKLRSRERLAYNVNAQVTWTRDGGILEAYLETDRAKRDRATSGLEAVTRHLFENGITEPELEANKILARAWFLRSLEGKEARVSSMGRFEFLGLGSSFIAGLAKEIDAIDLVSMNQFITQVLEPDRALTVIVGPESGK